MEPATLSIVLVDGVCEVPYKFLNVLSKSSFSFCCEDIFEDQNTFQCNYLRKDEFLTILDVLHGRKSIEGLNTQQFRFIETNLLLPTNICDFANTAYKEGAKLLATARTIQDKHIALLSGTSKVLMCSSMTIKSLFGSKSTYSTMYSDLDFIIPVQMICNEDGVRMILICEGVPIYTPELGLLPIRSDNLYKTRTDKDGSLIQPSCNGVCIMDGKCDIHTLLHKMFIPTLSTMDPILSCRHGVQCTGVYIPTKYIHTSDLLALSANGIVYMRNMYQQYCPDHFPYSKHTATQEKADAVMRILKSTPCMELDYRCSEIGFVNIK